ncbi:flagellin [Pedomonas sp. V897]|uniref:flagellin n=1 Tax=Pedomonas sp. V897 TaxID=3446482 RepID=UPI003EDFB24C
MAFSINTNVGAMVALQTLNSTNKALETTQSRINTGLKVASTKDDSGTYAIAQSLRADVGGLNAVRTSLDRAQSTLDVAISAAESISDVLVQMKEKATAASDEGMDQASREALQDDFNKLSEQLASYINSAEFNGTNILKSGGADLKALLNADDSTQTISVGNLKLNDGTDGALKEFVGVDVNDATKAAALEAKWIDTDAAGDPVIPPAVPDKTAAENARASADKVNAAIDEMKSVLSTLGSASRQISAQQEFTTKLTDTIEAGIGNLVDADLAKESARLQALQTKQQLGLQALAIANQAPQTILSLFR